MDGKKPQQAQQQADVVLSAAQHGMQRIIQRALEGGSVQPSISFHVPDGWLDGAAPLIIVFIVRVTPRF